jgi:tetratricopeptide (TPR) repeat protein
MGKEDTAEVIWRKVKEDFPHQLTINRYLSIAGSNYFSKAMEVGKRGNVDSALINMKKAVELDSSNAVFWYNLGGVYSLKQDLANTRQCWQKALAIDPNNLEARRGLESLR